MSGWRPETPSGLSGDGLPSKDNTFTTNPAKIFKQIVRIVPMYTVSLPSFSKNIPMNTPDNTTSKPLTEEKMDWFTLEHIQPVLLVRQSNTPRYLTYENEILVDQSGNPTTPEEHNTTHAEILGNIRKHRQWCRMEDDDEFMALLAKYLPQTIQIQIEMPKLERTNRPSVDLGLDTLPET